VNLAGAFFLLPEPAHRGAAPISGRGLATLLEALRRPGVRRVIVIYFLAVAAFSAMESTYAFLATNRYRLSDRHVAYVFAYIGVLVVVTQGVLIGPLTRLLGEKRLLVIGASLQAAGLAWLPFADGVSGLLLASAPLSVGSGLASPALSALLSRLSPDEEQGGALGVGQSAAALGRILGPESGTFTFARWEAAPYLGGAAIMAAAALVGTTLRGERSRP
jgi:predicted MFS family arabinose efflux permease